MSSTSLCYPHCSHRNPKYSYLPATVKANNSIAAKTSTTRKVFLNVLLYNKGLLPALQNAVLGFYLWQDCFFCFVGPIFKFTDDGWSQEPDFTSSGIVTSCTASSSSIKSLTIFFQFDHQILKEGAYNCRTKGKKLF